MSSEDFHKCDGRDCQVCLCERFSTAVLPNAAAATYSMQDRRLQHWEDYMRHRKRLQGMLGSRLNRRPGDLLMNAGDELRPVKEEKNLFEYAQILTPPDPQRGSPAFWNFPLELKNKEDACGRSYCFAQMTAEQTCTIPVIESVGVPTKILEEKDILPRTR